MWTAELCFARMCNLLRSGLNAHSLSHCSTSNNGCRRRWETDTSSTLTQKITAPLVIIKETSVWSAAEFSPRHTSVPHWDWLHGLCCISAKSKVASVPQNRNTLLWLTAGEKNLTCDQSITCWANSHGYRSFNYHKPGALIGASVLKDALCTELQRQRVSEWIIYSIIMCNLQSLKMQVNKKWLKQSLKRRQETSAIAIKE